MMMTCSPLLEMLIRHPRLHVIIIIAEDHSFKNKPWSAHIHYDLPVPAVRFELTTVALEKRSSDPLS